MKITADTRGTLVCNELILPITSIRFINRGIHIIAVIHNATPGDWDMRGELRIHGEDGTLLCTLPAQGNPLRVYRVTPGDTLTIDVKLGDLQGHWA